MKPKVQRYKNHILALSVMAIIVIASTGSYLFGAYFTSIKSRAEFGVEVHTWIRQYRDTDGDGVRELIMEQYNAGVLTNTGKDFIEGKLGNDAFANATDYADYLCMSTDSSSPSATWVNIPNELTASGLGRAEGTYASTGVGVYEIEKTFTATAQVVDIQLFGNCWDSVAGDGSLFFSDTCTPFTVEDQDQITLTAEVTIT